MNLVNHTLWHASPTTAASFRRLGGILGTRFGLGLSAVTLLSLCLNLWGNSWGLPDRWHPDEITARATKMVLRRSIDPEHYAYGGLHYYIVAAGAVIPAGAYAWLFDPQPDEMTHPEAYAEWRDDRITHVYILARSISAVMASFQILIVYGIGSLLFGRLIAISAALFLAVAPYFVVIAHFGTVDTAANFWYWLSILFAVLFWSRGGVRWYIFAALTAGLAIGTKLDRVIVILPLLFAILLRGYEFPIRRLLWSGIAVFAGYAVANPMLIISPFDFVDGTIRWLFLNMVRTTDASHFAVMGNIVQGLGMPLTLATLGGFGYALVNVATGRDRKEIGILLSSMLPLYLVYSSTVSVPWYVPSLFPGLALFASYGIESLSRTVSGRYQTVFMGAVIVVAGVSLTKSIMFEFQFLTEARYEAARWLEKHVPQNSTVELGPRHPVIDDANFEITQRPMDPRYHAFFATWRDRLADHELYLSIRQFLLDLEHAVAPFVGLAVREQAAEIGADHAGGYVDNVQLGAQQPDYVVLVEYLELRWIEELKKPDSGYRHVAHIRYEDLLGWNPRFPFLNSPVHVFERTAPLAGQRIKD